MGLISNFVYVNLTNKNKKYYKNKGYLFSNKEKTIKVKVEDLPNGSHAKVSVKCDNCNEILSIEWRVFVSHVHNNIYYCGHNKNNCCNKILLKGELNGFYGKKHTEESKKNMSKNNWSKKHKGELSPNWNPKITEEERFLKRSINPKYTEFIKKVLARDNYTCRCCGQFQGDIETHHLDGYDWCKEKRTDETNGITLCKTCHKNFHSIYGYGGNTKEQFEEWLGQAVELVKYEGELPTTKKIYCIEEDKIYDSADEICEEWDYKYSSNIYDVCNHKIKNRKSNDKIIAYECKTVKGKHLLWYDEYITMSKEEVENFLKTNPSKKIYEYYDMNIYSTNNKLLFSGTRKECCNWMVKNKYSKNIRSATVSIGKFYKNKKILNPKNKYLISIYFTTNYT